MGRDERDWERGPKVEFTSWRVGWFVGDVVELQKAKVTGLRCGRAF